MNDDLKRKFIKNRPSLDEYFTQLLPLIASRGTCIRRKVAAIVTDNHGTLLGSGYNGVPRGAIHCIDVPCPGAQDRAGDNNKCLAQHAELNCLFQAGSRLKEASLMYVSCSPCFSCAKMILCTTIQDIICLEIYADKEGAKLLMDNGRNVWLLQDGKRVEL